MHCESDPASIRPTLSRLNPLPIGRSRSSEPEVEERFLRSLYLEQRRSERSGRHFVLMLLESVSLFRTVNRSKSAERILAALRDAVRETDIVGWHKNEYAVGIIFTELGEADDQRVAKALLNRASGILATILSLEEISQVRLSLHKFPENWADQAGEGLHDSVVFPHVAPGSDRLKGYREFKRLIDILLSLLAILLISPILVATAVAVKLTSKGPILFKQQRLGLDGSTFTMFKFRSMHPNSSDTVHRDFVQRFINGESGGTRQSGEGKSVYKLSEDHRVTWIGEFLRRSSLDELPQLFNVLRGDMSLVGPRPPLAYEVERYRAWHRRRICGIRPGITGLWQAFGRSRVPFDDMVRMDLAYAKSCSLWLDTKILWRTAFVVLRGRGGY